MAAVRQGSLTAPAPSVEEKRQRRPVFRPKRKRNDPRPWRRSIVLLILLGSLLLLQLTYYALEMNLSFQLEEKQRNLNDALSATERLRMENHRDNSLELLEKRAQNLHFRKPTMDQYVYLK